MPIATVDPQSYTKYDLKSLPEGFVMLRALPYGMKLTRADKASKMFMRTDGKQTAGQTFELETMSEWAMHFDFKYCIGEHNLQNIDETLIDFANPMSLKMLDPKVGSEIAKYISELNEDEDEESLEDFLQRSTTSSESAEILSVGDSSDGLKEPARIDT